MVLLRKNAKDNIKMTESRILYEKKLREHRRALHMIPELDRELPETRKYLLSVLQRLDCTITPVCGDGLCAFFDKGMKDTFAFRADMDGLPIDEQNICGYASVHSGRMHACGHDGHMSMVLTLGEYINSASSAEHNVLLIFQPAEETLGGAEEICRTGILKKYNVTRVFGIHLWPFIEKSHIASRPGAFMPRSAEVNIHVRGKAAHGTAPYEGLDALYIGASIIRDIYMKHSERPGAIPHFSHNRGDLPKAPETPPEKRTLIHFGKMESGYARNVVSDYSHILGTVRAFCDEDFRQITDLIRQCAREAESVYGSPVEFTCSSGYPPVINDRELYEKIRPVLDSLPSYTHMELPLMISEDFSFYGLFAPAVFFILGTGTGIPLHSSDFDFDEDILYAGLDLYLRLLRIG